MSEEKEEEKKSNKMETWCGLLLGVFAAVLAIASLGGGKYGGDQMVAVIEKGEAYNWYQSKSIKQNLAENERDFIKSLLDVGLIAGEKKKDIDSLLTETEKKIKTYKKEKNEIMKGSKAVGKENWVQDVEGKMGQVIGVNDWKETIDALGDSCDYFDLANLFLQIALVMGAICLISPSETGKKSFFIIMIGLGIIGSAYTAYGFIVAP
jgi:hypothetical protein